MKKIELIDIPNFSDSRGKISILETGSSLPFKPERIFFIYKVPDDQIRGEHANINTKFILIAIHGSITIEADDGNNKQTFILNSPNQGLFLDSGTWKVMKNFKDDAVLIAIANTKYDKNEYITDYSKFKKRYKS